MITTTYIVQCDGDSDDEDADYFCEAEFDHVDGPGGLGDLAHLRRQLAQRGWRAVPTDGPLQVFCPLHPAADPASGDTP